MGELPRRRADDRLARPHLSRRGRRLPALPEGRDAGGADGVRRGQRSAVARGAHPQGASPRRGRGAATLLRWSRRSAADVMRSTSAPTRCAARRWSSARWCGASRRSCPAPASARLTYAMRHVGRVGRPVGGSGMVPRVAAPRVRGCRRHAAHDHQGRPLTCEGDAVRGMVCTDGTEITARIVVSACNPHDTFLDVAHGSAAAGRVLVRSVASDPPRRRLRVEDRRDRRPCRRR